MLFLRGTTVPVALIRGNVSWRRLRKLVVPLPDATEASECSLMSEGWPVVRASSANLSLREPG